MRRSVARVLRGVRAAAREAVPEGALEAVRPVREVVERVRLRGNDVTCPICSATFARFARFNGRDGARCPSCGSLERHRLLWLWLERATDLFVRPQRVLHVAPESFLRDRLSAVHGGDYVHGDLNDPAHPIDVMELPFTDGAFDVAICSHVLEHVPDDLRAVREFSRVLVPDGWAILDAPVDERREVTYEDPSITSPAGRRRHFGQWDHVRVYGRDYVDLLARGGFDVVLPTVEFRGDEVARYGLRPAKDRLYRCLPASAPGPPPRPSGDGP